MKGTMLSFIREPLVHFLLLGVAFFAADAVFSGRSARTVIITEQEISNYINANTYKGISASREDSLLLTEKLITKKILLAEARNRKFDMYDPVVSERLIDRMQLALIRDTVPSDEQALAYYHAHPGRYQTDLNAHPTFQAVKTQVLNDLMMELREESYRQNLQNLVEQYAVRIE